MKNEVNISYLLNISVNMQPRNLGLVVYETWDKYVSFEFWTFIDLRGPRCLSLKRCTFLWVTLYDLDKYRAYGVGHIYEKKAE